MTLSRTKWSICVITQPFLLAGRDLPIHPFLSPTVIVHLVGLIFLFALTESTLWDSAIIHAARKK